MDKEYRFGVIKKIGKTPLWGQPHESIEECLNANIDYIKSHLGQAFVIQAFTKVQAPK